MFSQPVSEVYEIEKFHRSLYDNMNDLYISEEDIKRALKKSAMFAISNLKL